MDEFDGRRLHDHHQGDSGLVMDLLRVSEISDHILENASPLSTVLLELFASRVVGDSDGERNLAVHTILRLNTVGIELDEPERKQLLKLFSDAVRSLTGRVKTPTEEDPAAYALERIASNVADEKAELARLDKSRCKEAIAAEQIINAAIEKCMHGADMTINFVPDTPESDARKAIFANISKYGAT